MTQDKRFERSNIMNKNIKKLTGVVTTGALVMTLGVGIFGVTNTSVFAAETTDEVTIEQSERGRGGMKAFGDSEDGTRPDKSEMGDRSGGMNGRKGGRQGKSLDLDALVEAELLDADQVVEIEALQEEISTDREAEKELIDEMTDDERQAYFEEKKEAGQGRVSLLDKLVDESIIDEDEATAIEEYLKENRPERENKGNKTEESVTEEL